MREWPPGFVIAHREPFFKGWPRHRKRIDRKRSGFFYRDRRMHLWPIRCCCCSGPNPKTEKLTKKANKKLVSGSPGNGESLLIKASGRFRVTIEALTYPIDCWALYTLIKRLVKVQVQVPMAPQKSILLWAYYILSLKKPSKLQAHVYQWGLFSW